MTLSYIYPNNYGQEDVDHINISARSETHLGKLLDPSYLKTLDYPHIGKFGSVMNLWYWLRTEPCNDALRRATGAKLRKILKQSNSDAYVTNFSAIIAHATYLKLKDYPNAIDRLRTLSPDIQFVSYYVPQGTKIRVCGNYAKVIVPIADILRQAIQSGVEPDFSQLLPKNTDDSLAWLSPFLSKRFPQLHKTITAT